MRKRQNKYGLYAISLLNGFECGKKVRADSDKNLQNILSLVAEITLNRKALSERPPVCRSKRETGEAAHGLVLRGRESLWPQT
jgi:hypothetical protein